jgi:hypothetical protein
MTHTLINKGMSTILESCKSLRELTNHVSLPEAIDSATFIHSDNCYLIKSLYENRGPVTVADLQDETGFECYVNHIHLDDYAFDERLLAALRVASVIENRWMQSQYRDLPLRQIISLDDESCVYRFHVRRNGQNWLAADLGKYEELLIVIDSRAPAL